MRVEAIFLEKVIELHPKAEEKPCVIGNCQAGWAVLMLAAVRPELFGPIIVPGSPLSYWAGVKGQNPMRYLGGLLGGSWVTALISDLGAGKFDGANLVANFEVANPSNTFWTKAYNVWSQVDTEPERFLEFEENGFHPHDVLDRLVGHGIGCKTDEIGRMSGTHGDAEFTVGLETADARPVTRAGIDDNEWPFRLIDLDSFGCPDSGQKVVSRLVERAAIEDQIDIELEHVRYRHLLLRVIVVAALAHHIPEQDSALHRVDHVLAKRSAKCLHRVRHLLPREPST